MELTDVKTISPIWVEIFLHPFLFIDIFISMKQIILSEAQYKKLLNNLKENKEGGSYMAKQQLFTIATLAYKMWESMEDGVELDDWMETKIAQSEMGIVSVVKAFMYDEFEEGRTPDTLNYDELIIGR